MTPLYTIGQPVQINATLRIGKVTHIRNAVPGFWPTTYTVEIPGQFPNRIYHEPELAPIKGAVHVTNSGSLPAGRVVDLHRRGRRRGLPHPVAPGAPEAA